MLECTRDADTIELSDALTPASERGLRNGACAVSRRSSRKRSSASSSGHRERSGFALAEAEGAWSESDIRIGSRPARRRGRRGQRTGIDSDVLIDYLRGHGAGHGIWFGPWYKGSGYRVTAVTALELALGRSYRENPRPVHASLPFPADADAQGRAASWLVARRAAASRGADRRSRCDAGRHCLETGATLRPATSPTSSAFPA